MSVQINYHGRLGNNLFQYFAGRFLAEENGMRLGTRWNGGNIISISDNADVNARDGNGAFQRIGDEHDALSKKWPKGNYTMDAYFQIGDWYFSRKQKILSLVKLPPIYLTDPATLVVSVRLTDFIGCKAAIGMDWYCGILDRESFTNLLLVTDDPKNPLLRKLDRFKPRLVPGDPMYHFFLLRSARRLVMSNSTFCWWASFLGRAETLYIFSRWIGNPNAKLGNFPGAIQVEGKFLHET